MLITIEEARAALRLDGTDNDAIITSYLESIPSYLEATTGHDWAADEPVEPLAQTVTKFILQLWYNPQGPDSVRLKQAIDGLLTTLEAMAGAMDDV
jgi:hypothetical protein